MEKFRCKLCLRKFANGRALGGHMRSHMMNLRVPLKKEQQKQEQLQMINADDDDQQPPSEEFVQVVPPPSSTSSSSSSEDEENDKNSEEDLSCYGLRENPKRSIRTMNPEYFSAVEADSVVLQDRESETESSKNHNCRRSKRTRKSRISDTYQCSSDVVDHYIKGKIPRRIQESSSSFVEPEPVSSISETTPEEDVAYCLMMLSRDKWVIEQEEEEKEEEGDDFYDEEDEKKCTSHDLNGVDFAVVKVTKARSSRGKYRCETCNKMFRSYQALGGHRASHKKMKFNNETASKQEASERVMMVEEKIHKCPVCFRVFSSGQALGGHKRSHGIVAATAPATTANVAVAKPGSRMIDLNLPAPIDDDDDDDGEISQMEVSAISD